MDHYDQYGNGIGGGEVLDLFGSNELAEKFSRMNQSLIQQYRIIPIILIIILLLIIFVMIRAIMSSMNIKSLRRGRGIISELDYMQRVKKNDAKIIRYNTLIQRINAIVEKSPFRLDKNNREYWTYNLNRANVRIPGGTRVYKADEFHSIIVVISALLILLSAAITIFINYMLGLILILFILIMSETLPMMVIRLIVKEKDLEIQENFADFYLMIHYVLIAKAKTPLSGIMKSYAKTTDSDEMKHMVDVCIHYMDTYGEYEGTKFISNEYKEIPQMVKLMRLISQSLSGGNVDQELIGFREELLSAKKYAIEVRTNKLINRAKASFNILMIILVQAILSAMSIYMSDMGLIKTFM